VIFNNFTNRATETSPAVKMGKKVITN